MSARPRMMPGLRIVYDAEIPPEISGAIEAEVEANLDLLPSWVLLLLVRFDTEGEGRSAAKLEYEVAYRRATLIVFACWMDNTPAVRTEIMYHEFLHAHVAPLHVAANGVANLLTEHNKQLGESCLEDIRFALEQCVVDLTELVARLRAQANDRESDVGALPLHGEPCRSGPTTKQIRKGEEL